jgi:hypothetical protein
VAPTRATDGKFVAGSLQRPLEGLSLLRSLRDGRRCYFIADSARTRQGIT